LSVRSASDDQDSFNQSPFVKHYEVKEKIPLDKRYSMQDFT